MYTRIKNKVNLLLDPNDGGTLLDKIINVFIVILILLNAMAVILETVNSLYGSYKLFFDGFEVFSVTVFSIEYILRVWSCTANEKYKHPITGRLKYIISIGGIIDILAILPFYLPRILPLDLRILRLLRLLRFFRFFKLGRYMHASIQIKKVFVEKKEELILSVVLTSFLIVIASSIMYFVEHDSQPDKFSSIPATMWWSVSTLTTVGYGDMFPVTSLGKTLTSFISILGIGLFALPAGILAAGFTDAFKKVHAPPEEKHYCPHCHKPIDN